jgi:hypothetical protein
MPGGRMSRFRVFRKLGAGQRGVVEKCPICSEGWVDFIDINGDGSLLGCFKCGCVFISKSLRDSELQGKKEQIEKQSKVECKPAPMPEKEVMIVVDGVPLNEGETIAGRIAEINDPNKFPFEVTMGDVINAPSLKFICPTCQKVCKNQVGLMAHMRSHKAESGS